MNPTNPIDVAQYGIGFFAVACLVVIAVLAIKLQYQKGQGNNTVQAAVPSPRCSEQLKTVIENNTKAVNELTKVTTSIQLSITRQGAQQDEILARLREQN